MTDYFCPNCGEELENYMSYFSRELKWQKYRCNHCDYFAEYKDRRWNPKENKPVKG